MERRPYINPFHRPWLEKNGAAAPASGNIGLKGIIAGMSNYRYCSDCRLLQLCACICIQVFQVVYSTYVRQDGSFWYCMRTILSDHCYTTISVSFSNVKYVREFALSRVVRSVCLRFSPIGHELFKSSTCYGQRPNLYRRIWSVHTLKWI